MKSPSPLKHPVLLLLLIVLLSACSGSSRSIILGVQKAQLAPCPTSPNCVSSDASDAEHQIAPLTLKGTTDATWTTIRTLVTQLPRTQIITETDDYLHAESRSALFGFVDDLELHLRPAEGIIAVRSAARSGYSDFGVNRQRIEKLRTALRTRDLTP